MRLSIVLGFAIVGLTACGSVTPTANSIAALQIEQPAKKSDLLYVSDSSTGDVYVYTYPQGTLSQTLTGFGEPLGLCVDKKGDVFVADEYDADIVEYPHGGSSPIATFSDANHNPGGCAVNPKNGDLAVANLHNASSTGAHGPATISLYKPKSSKYSNLYSDSAFAAFWYCGYDAKGNLFVDGYKKNGSATGLAELPNGSSTFTNLKLSQTLLAPGGVQWNRKYLAVSDQQMTIYQFSISNGNATEHGSSSLQDANGLYEFWIEGPDVAGTSSGSGSVGIWKYPSGGSPIKTITGLTTPLGLTISSAK
jgi:hypothetical protein